MSLLSTRDNLGRSIWVSLGKFRHNVLDSAPNFEGSLPVFLRDSPFQCLNAVSGRMASRASSRNLNMQDSVRGSFRREPRETYRSYSARE